MPPNSSDPSLRRWDLPPLDSAPEAAAPVEEAPPLPTAEEIEALQRQAWEEGYQSGRREGLAAAEQETAERIRRLDALLDALARPLDELDDAVEQELVFLAMAVARQLIRRELKSDPGQIVGVIREALALLPVADGDLRLELHPEDARLVRELLNLDEGDDRSWRIVEDPTLTRGGCRIANRTSRIDATVESRIHAAIAKVLGAERTEDRA